MTTLSLNFINRLKLTGILSGARGGDGGYDKLHALLVVFAAVRFTEDELAKITVTDLGNGTTHYRITDPQQSGSQFCAKLIQLEDTQAKWVLKELDAWVVNATIEDMGWIDPLKSELTSKAPKPAAEMKRKK